MNIKVKLFGILVLALSLLNLSADGGLDDFLKFHAPFDDSVEAVVAEGESAGKPVRKAHFTQGVFGKALKCGKGGTGVNYLVKDNLDLDNPGSVTLWFKIDCEHGTTGPAIGFFGTGYSTEKGILSLTVLNDPMKYCPCMRQIGFMLFSKRRKTKNYTVLSGKNPICSGWHFLVGSWAGGKLFVSLDGQPCRSFEPDKPLSNAEFEYCKKFGVGSALDRWEYAIDDLRIYGKRLSDSEIKSLYDEGIKNLNKLPK